MQYMDIIFNICTMNKDLLYLIALTQIQGIGNIRAKSLINNFENNLESLFTASLKNLLSIENIGTVLAQNFISQREKALEKATIIINESIADQVVIVAYTSNEYPYYLKFCVDCPLVLYFKGSALSLLQNKMLSIVGTRNATEYGKKITEQIVSELQHLDVVVVSGLAYGVDVMAHQKAIQLNIPTIGVLAHGLDIIYPSQHGKYAQEMLKNGGLLSEYPFHTKPDREHFPARNRIVAGLSEATIVVEAAKKGGALITANLADGYNREVFAVPGRIDDLYSEGCNYLIKNNRAQIYTNVKNIFTVLRWEVEKSNTVQPQLFLELTPNEQIIYDLLLKKPLHIDALCSHSDLSISEALNILFNLEMNGVVKSLPGKMYQIY